MATLKIKKDIDFVELRERIAEQFRGLDTSNPSSWPLLPRILLCVGVALVVFAGAWYFLINDQMDELAKRQKQETELKKDYVDKYAKVVNLEPLRKQRQQVEQYVVQLEKQLPVLASRISQRISTLKRMRKIRAQRNGSRRPQGWRQ